MVEEIQEALHDWKVQRYLQKVTFNVHVQACGFSNICPAKPVKAAGMASGYLTIIMFSRMVLLCLLNKTLK